MNFTEIKYQKDGPIARLTLNRPNKLNALTPTMLSEWREALETIAQDSSCRVVIINGEGKAWSAGVDLSVFQESKVEKGFKMWEDGMAVIDLLETMPQVSICMLNGYCYTGAMEIMMGFDLIIAADEAKIGDTHCKWGIPPKWGMTQRLMHQVGMRKAKELSFTAQPISGTEAAKIGLVNKSVPLADLESAVMEMANHIIENSAQAIAVVKELYQFGSLHTLKEGIQFEIDYKASFTDKTDTLKNFKQNYKK